jgi:hypothetical protein
MRRDEAEWINAAVLRHLPVPGREAVVLNHEAVVLNLGSGSKRSREVQKPHIHELTLVLDVNFVAKLRALQPSLVYFCNVFEHVDAKLREQLPAILASIVRPGGLLLVSAPQSYPYHPDPIDTYYRVTPPQIAALFPGFQVLESQAVDCGNYGQEFSANSPFKQLRRVLRLFFPFIAPRRWMTLAHKFLWMNKPYQIACVLMRRPEAPEVIARGGLV